jgi:hypothetical protein
MNAIQFFDWGVPPPPSPNRPINQEVVIGIEGIEEELPINAYSSIYSVHWTAIQNFITAKNTPYAGFWGNAKIELLGKNTFKIWGVDQYTQHNIDTVYKLSSVGQGNRFLQFSLSFDEHKYYDLIVEKYVLEGFNVRYAPGYYSLPSLIMQYNNNNNVVDLYNFKGEHPDYKYYYPFKFKKK